MIKVVLAALIYTFAMAYARFVLKISIPMTWVFAPIAVVGAAAIVVAAFALSMQSIVLGML
ncbi:hypothetical protein EVB91_249 [Rhizobium phage RHph_I1_18]|nr:hypothetical protein EVB91_249 [Rhizobium phage RHph_I1_18]